MTLSEGALTLYLDRATLRPRPSVVPLPRVPGAAAHVLIDGRHYASFGSVKAAEAARDAWLESWPALKGKRNRIKVEVVR